MPEQSHVEYAGGLISSWLKEKNYLQKSIRRKLTDLVWCMGHLLFSHFCLSFAIKGQCGSMACSFGFPLSVLFAIVIVLLGVLYGYFGVKIMLISMDILDLRKELLTISSDGSTVGYLMSRFQGIEVNNPLSLTPLVLFSIASLGYGFYLPFLDYYRFCG